MIVTVAAIDLTLTQFRLILVDVCTKLLSSCLRDLSVFAMIYTNTLSLKAKYLADF